MNEDIVQSLINGAAVTVGLFALWSLVSQMRRHPVATRFGYALFAGVVSAIVMFVVRLFV